MSRYAVVGTHADGGIQASDVPYRWLFEYQIRAKNINVIDKDRNSGEQTMIAKFLTVGWLAGFAAATVAQPVELVLDEHALVEFDVPPYVADAGIRAIDYFPFEQPPRIAIQTHLADLTCEFQDASGAVVSPPFVEGGFSIEIDRIPTPFGENDPNVNFDGQPIDRQYPLDPASGSISQIFLDGIAVLDICTSGAACAAPAGESVRLFCREAGTRIFDADFEAIVADLAVQWDTDPPGQPNVVAGSVDGRIVTLTASNLGALDVGGVDVAIDGILPIAGAGCPQLLTAGADFAFDQNCSGLWSIGDLGGGEAQQLQFRVTADADAQLDDLIGLDASINSPGIGDVDLLNNQQALNLSIVKQVNLQVGISSVPNLELDMTQPPGSASFGISVTPEGPSILNRMADIQLAFPSGPNVQINSTNPDFDIMSGVWSPVIGSTTSGLSVFFTVDSFEPGTANFCVGVTDAVDPASANVTLTTSGDLERCLDVIGPESVNLTLTESSPVTVVAGSAPVAGQAGNLIQTFTVANDNDTFTARELSAQIQLPASVEPLLASVEPAAGLTVEPGDPTLWNWSIGDLPAGQQVSADFIFDIPPDAAGGTVVEATLLGLSVAPDQVLVDPAAGITATTTIERAYDLASEVVQSFPEPPNSVIAEPGSAPVGNLEFLYEVGHADSNASNATQVLTDIAISGPGGAVLPVGTVTIDSVSVPTGDSVSGTGLQRSWDIGSLANDVAINPRATIVLTVFEGIGDGAQVCLTGSIASTAAGESETDASNDSVAVCASVSDGSSPQ